MSAPVGTPPAPVPPAEGSAAGRWTVAVVVLLAAAVLAVVGSALVVRSLLEDRAMNRYDDARRTAAYFVGNGETAGRAMRQLRVLDAQDVTTMRRTRRAEAADDAEAYNLLTMRANRGNVRQMALLAEIEQLRRGFEKVYAEYRAERE